MIGKLFCNIAKSCNACPYEFPEKPKSTVIIDTNGIRELLRPYGITFHSTTIDFQYKLPSRAEVETFLKWYKSHRLITPWQYKFDELDCDDFAWVLRAFWIIWTRGEYFFGYIEASSTEGDILFDPHGFNYLITDDFSVWFTDQLEVAANDVDLMPAYPINCTENRG